jgi:iron complex outermembrane receptor protein
VRALAGAYEYRGWYPSDVVYEDANKGAWGGVGSQLAWDVAPGHRLLAGGDLHRTARARYSTKADGVETDDNDFPFSTWSVYVADELTVSSVFTLLAGLRKDGHSDGAGSASPRLGLIVTPGRSTTAKLLWGKGFRTPTVYEREYEKALQPAEVGPERIRTTELVLEQRLGGSVQLTASIFDNHVRGLIDATADNYFTNVSEAQTRGIEALVQARLSGGLTAYAGYAYTDARDPSTNGRLSNAPAQQLKVGGATPRSFGVLALEGRYEAGRRTVLGTETDGGFVVNGAFTSRPVFGGLRMTARVTDLFDSGFSVPGGFEHAQSAIPQGPRAISFGLGYRW